MSDVSEFELDDLSLAYARLQADLAQAESALGTAQAEITRLEDALRDAAQMFTIIGARKVIAAALNDSRIEASPHKRQRKARGA